MTRQKSLLESLQRSFDLRFPPQAQLDAHFRSGPTAIRFGAKLRCALTSARGARAIEAVGLPNLSRPFKFGVINKKAWRFPTGELHPT